MARPRVIRSAPTAGIGGRPFTEDEADALHEIAELYDLDVDRDALLDRLCGAFARYQANVEADSMQVGVADEIRDLEAVVTDLTRVRQLLIDRVEQSDPAACIGPAGMLARRLHNFPNMIAAETTRLPEGVEFMHAQLRLINSIVRVHYWPKSRASLIADIDLLISVCKTVAIPPSFTKRHRSARNRFAEDLAEIYMKDLHPKRMELWLEVRDERNDPPPPESRNEFSHAVMRALAVPFEVKRSKG